ncbi:AAA family ATPase, partial [Bathymodiolus thermophilus thioautotrophic gill symbiont]
MEINSVKVKNFKSLKDVDIKLNNLTLITGVNSSGKSSFIQSLLLFRQNRDVLITSAFAELRPKSDALPFYVSFNGTYIKLGEETSLLSQSAFNDNMAFELNTKFGGVTLLVNKKQEVNLSNFDKKAFENGFKTFISVLLDNCFHYLSTSRMPPDHTFGFSQQDINLDSIGVRGEFTAHYLAEKRHQKLKVKELKHPKSETLQLLENTYKWLGEISSGVSILASSDASTQSAKLTYQYEYKDNTTSNYSSLNVGFGLTYVLPVIVLILKSKPGDFIIIENPESHLHPAGQSKIAEMCAIAANSGVQVIIESHSDHFLNGLRVATKNGKISPENSQIYFFKKDKNSLETEPHPISIDKDGKLSDWPKSFFDEWGNG